MGIEREDNLDGIAKIIDPDAWHETLPTDGCGAYWIGRRNDARGKANQVVDALQNAKFNKAGGLWYRRWFKAQERVNELERMLESPPRHRFWGAGEANCPGVIKAGNGELHTLRCKACGLDNPRDQICLATPKEDTPDA